MNDEIIQSEIRNLTLDQFWTLLEKLENNQGAFDDAVFTRCREDIEAFATIFFPHYCKYPFNRFHRDAFRAYQFGERNIRRASGAPRGFAKSTIKVLIKPIHDVCYQLEKFIVILSNTEAQSVQKLKDIQAELITNENLISVYGRLLQGRKHGSSDCVVSNADYSCRILALGSGTEMRGIRYRDARPSKIILDDIEHSTEVENEMLRRKLNEWYADVVSKIGDENTNIEIVGTILHQESLLKTLCKNARYESKIYKAIESWSDRRDLWDQWTAIYTNLDDDERLKKASNFYLEHEKDMLAGVSVLWPEKEPYLKLMEEIIETGLRSFMKEKQNDPLGDTDKIFNPDQIWWYKEVEHGLLIEKTNVLVPWQALTAYGAIDPATGQKKVSQNRDTDFTAILSGYVDQKKRLFVDSDFLKRVAPSVFIAKIFELHKQYEYYKFGVETNLFRNLLLDNIRSERKRIELFERVLIDIKFYDIELHDNKEKRIYTLEPKIFHGHILFNRDKISQEFMNQLYNFPKGTHDDAPDCLEMLYGLVCNKYEVRAIEKDIYS